MKSRAMLQMAWLTLCRDRLGLALYAIVPIVFLSIFATVFEGFGRHGENRVRVALLDLDGSPSSARLIEAARSGSDRLELEVIESDDHSENLIHTNRVARVLEYLSSEILRNSLHSVPPIRVSLALVVQSVLYQPIDDVVVAC